MVALPGLAQDLLLLLLHHLLALIILLHLLFHHGDHQERYISLVEQRLAEYDQGLCAADPVAVHVSQSDW